jgi:preprotein translocase subunit SecA
MSLRPLSTSWQPPAAITPRPLPEGVDQVAHWLAGWWYRIPWQRPRLWRLARQSVAAMEGLASCTASELQQLLQQQRERIRRRRRRLSADEHRTALALVGEMAARQLGLRPYPVQMLGALALGDGYLAEMATGEGKSLTVALAAVVAAWSGRPCHILTANDYLAARDAAEMAPLYHACGLTVAAVTGEVAHQIRAGYYQADLVYTTAKELLGDFLRDRALLEQGIDGERIALHHWIAGARGSTPWGPLLLVRGLDTVFVDEADSLLIDEAVTPLILSLPRDDQGLQQAVVAASGVADQLRPGHDYGVLRPQRTVDLYPSAEAAMATINATLPPLWQAAARRNELLRQALVARHFFLRDHHYVVSEDKVILLDESTGRMTPLRSLSAGLHQAVEAHEGVTITTPSETLGQMSFQAFFRHFRHLAGTTGTAREAVAEFWSAYRLPLLAIPPHRPPRRRHERVAIFATASQRWQAVVAAVIAAHRQGQPILIGVRSVAASEALAAILQQADLPFALLNARHPEAEAAIVAAAGAHGSITVATNMAGRGTDIKLAAGVVALGGLRVIITEYHESARIDRQLAGRCGRQGDPGVVAVMVSLEDELVQRYLPAPLIAPLRLSLALGRMGEWLVVLAFKWAQRRANRQAVIRRRIVVKGDEWLQRNLPFVRQGRG